MRTDRMLADCLGAPGAFKSLLNELGLDSPCRQSAGTQDGGIFSYVAP